MCAQREEEKRKKLSGRKEVQPATFYGGRKGGGVAPFSNKKKRMNIRGEAPFWGANDINAGKKR